MQSLLEEKGGKKQAERQLSWARETVSKNTPKQTLFKPAQVTAVQQEREARDIQFFHREGGNPSGSLPKHTLGIFLQTSDFI